MKEIKEMKNIKNEFNIKFSAAYIDGTLYGFDFCDRLYGGVSSKMKAYCGSKNFIAIDKYLQKLDV